ncbi:hypothetical protein FF38_07231, partial [Lucilia cuprina]
AFWNMQEFFQEYLPFSQKEESIIKKTVFTKELKEVCDEKKLILQLARLYIISPERIILLLTRKSLNKECLKVADVLQHINSTISVSIPLPVDNLYMKLYNSLDYYNSYVCLYNPNTRGNLEFLCKIRNLKSSKLSIMYHDLSDLINYHECLTELHEDLLDCEGPPDWFEKTNEAIVCQYYNEIINCHYIKAALLCGLKPALMLRTFSNEIMKRIVTVTSFIKCFL